MKNHFVFPYAGNKRQEVDKIHEVIKNELKTINTIIEPYCGSSAMSYYISTLYPKKFKYILNDTDENLIKLYDIMRNKEKLDEFYKELNFFIEKFNLFTEDEPRKEFYKSFISSKNIASHFVKNRYYCINVGTYPMISTIKQIKEFSIEDKPIYNFLMNEDIKFLNCDGIDLYEQFKENEDCLFLIDPPYIMSSNLFYKQKTTTIYEYMFNNPIIKEKSKIVLVLENNWIIKLLFSENIKSTEYEKKYGSAGSLKKTKTNHIIISNF